MQNKKTGIIIFNTFMIGCVLSLAFFSQNLSEGKVSDSIKSINPVSIRKGGGFSSLSDSGINIDSAKENAYEKISQLQEDALEVGESLKSNTINQVNNAKENTVDSTKKFIAQKVLQVLGVSASDMIEGENLQCQ